MRLRVLLALVLGISTPLVVSASASPTIVTPAQVHWAAAPHLGPGVDMASIFGNPMKSGPYVFRLRLRDGVVFPPHFHNDTERVTVLSGTLLVGLGDKVDRAHAIALPAGSIVSIPAGIHHYAIARGTTILQLDGTGPFRLIPVRGHM